MEPVELPVEERVAAGAAYLDAHPERYGDWVDRIDEDELDINSCVQCMLGQLEGDYSDGMDNIQDAAEFPTVGDWNTDYAARCDWSTEHGFCGYNYPDELSLTSAWATLIRERRAAREAN